MAKSPVEALKSASCSVLPRDRIAIMGASGSGKSTLLHLMGALDKPTSGSIVWPSLEQPLRPGKIGFVFQTHSLLPTLSVIENIELPLILMNQDEKEARNAGMELLERIGLSELKDKLPSELSGGQLQRVAMARVLAAKPKLILADEPTGQLDHPTAQNLITVLLTAIENTDTAVVIATHDSSVAQRMRSIWNIRHGVLEVSDLLC
jgi:putative ABC transport system ATP-binding protein/lipoprotein-releasing system ATP-binding protein